MTRRIIALSGAKSSGKTTTFDIIKQLRPDVHEVTFAGKLKRVCSEVFNIPMETLQSPHLKEKEFKKHVTVDSRMLLEIAERYGKSVPLDLLGKCTQTKFETPRKLLQFIGAEFLRELDQDIHVNAAFEGLPSEGLIVITDMRFVSEFEKIVSIGAETFHIDNKKAEDSSRNDFHPSEMQRLQFKDKCLKIDNNFSLEKLKEEVIRILNNE